MHGFEPSANGTPNYHTNFPSLEETEPEFQVFWDIINLVDVLCIIDTIGSPLSQGCYVFYGTFHHFTLFRDGLA